MRLLECIFQAKSIECISKQQPPATHKTFQHYFVFTGHALNAEKMPQNMYMKGLSADGREAGGGRAREEMQLVEQLPNIVNKFN